MTVSMQLTCLDNASLPKNYSATYFYLVVNTRTGCSWKCQLLNCDSTFFAGIFLSWQTTILEICINNITCWVTQWHKKVPSSIFKFNCNSLDLYCSETTCTTVVQFSRGIQTFAWLIEIKQSAFTHAAIYLLWTGMHILLSGRQSAAISDFSNVTTQFSYPLLASL